MRYHDDLIFIGADHLPGCTVQVDRAWPGTWSLEFSGGGRMYQKMDDGPMTEIDRPIAFWHQPEHRYRYGPGDDASWDHHWVLMKGDRAQRIVVEGLAPLSSEGWLPVVDATSFGVAMRSLVDLVRDGDSRRHARGVALLEGLVAQLVEQPAVAAAGPHRAALLALADRIRREPLMSWDAAVEAGRLGLSCSHYRRLFRETVGRSPYTYVVGCRMRAAAEILRESPRPINEVATEVGYADPLRFSKVFRQHVGLSPRAYRRAVPTSM